MYRVCWPLPDSDRASILGNPGDLLRRRAPRPLWLVSVLGLALWPCQAASAAKSFVFELDEFDGLRRSYKEGWKVDDASPGSSGGKDVVTEALAATISKRITIPESGTYKIAVHGRDRGTSELIQINRDLLFPVELPQSKAGSDHWETFPAVVSATHLEAGEYLVEIVHKGPPGKLAMLDYLVFTCLDCEGEPAGPSEPPLTGKPDLTCQPDDVSFHSSQGELLTTGVADEPTTIEVEVHNQGPAAVENVKVRFFERVAAEENTIEGEVTIAQIAPGGVGTADVSPVLEAGTHELGVELDPHGEIDEADEENNRVELKFTVSSDEWWVELLGKLKAWWQGLPQNVQYGLMGGAGVLVLLLVKAVMPKRPRRVAKVKYLGVVCEECGADLEPGAKVCTLCGYRLDGSAPADLTAPPAAPPPAAAPVAAAGHACPHCGAATETGDRICTNCGRPLGAATAPAAEAAAPVPPAADTAAAQCTACGAALEAGGSFCTSCGAKSAAASTTAEDATPQLPSQPGPACPGCGQSLKPGQGFCSTCGTKIE